MKPIYNIETVKTYDDYGTVITYFEYPHRLPEVQWMVVEEVEHEPTTTYKQSGQVITKSRSKFFKLGDTIYQEGERGVGIPSVEGKIVELRPQRLEITIRRKSGSEETLLYGEMPIMTQRDLLMEQNFEKDRYADYLLDKIDDFADDLTSIYHDLESAKNLEEVDEILYGEIDNLLDSIERER